MMKIGLMLLCFAFAACHQTNEVVEPISVSIQNLPAIAQGEGHYQLWVRYYNFNKVTGPNSPQHEGAYLSLGEFNVGQHGGLEGLNGGSLQFSLPVGNDAQLLSDVVLSVQPPEGLAKIQHAKPGSILLGSKFTGDASSAVADLNLTYASAFGTNFSTATGKCTIVAPTSPTDSNSGIWFVESPVPSVGLRNLPVQKGAWRYEGWVVDETSNAYFSTGRFSRADSADYDGAGPNGGTGTAYNFPGEDFVRGLFRPNLTNTQFVFMVTIEPEPDNAPSPFFLRLLRTSASPVPVIARTEVLQNVIVVSPPSVHIVIQR